MTSNWWQSNERWWRDRGNPMYWNDHGVSLLGLIYLMEIVVVGAGVIYFGSRDGW